jgi:hypothetical protein
MKKETYKGFIIEDNTTRYGGKQYSVYNNRELWVGNFDTKKAAKEFINKGGKRL